MADRLSGGQLRELMSHYITDSGSWEHVARELHTQAGVEVSGQTLRRWARVMGIERPVLPVEAGAA